MSDINESNEFNETFETVRNCKIAIFTAAKPLLLTCELFRYYWGSLWDLWIFFRLRDAPQQNNRGNCERSLQEGKETDINNHLQLGTPLADYLSSVTSVCRRHYAKSNKQLGFVDEVAVAYALSSDKIVKKHRMLRASVELSGEYTRHIFNCNQCCGIYFRS